MDPGIRSLVLSRLEADGSADDAWSGLVLAALEGRRRSRRSCAGGAGRGRRTRRADGPGARRRLPAVDRGRGLPRHRPAADARAAAGPGPHARRRAQRLRQVELRRGARGPADRRQPALEGARRRLARGLAQPPPPGGVARARRSSSRAQRDRAWCRGAGRARPTFEAAEVAAQAPRRAARATSEPSAGPRRCARTGPFLSYNELGSLLDEGPSKLYDALSSILGLEDLVQALGALQEARRSREKALKEATDARGRLLERLRGVDDDARGARSRPALEGKDWDLGAVEAVARRRLAGRGRGRGRGRRAARDREPRAAGPGARRGRGRARCARRPRRVQLQPRDGVGPLARRGGAPRERAPLPRGPRRRRLPGVREEGRARRRAGASSSARPWRACATRRARRTPSTQRADAARRAVGGPGAAEARGAHAGGRGRPRPRPAGRGARAPGSQAGSIADLGELADHVESASGPLREAIVRLRDAARAELGRREDAWRPLAVEVAAWLGRRARRRSAEPPTSSALKPAEAWLKKAAAGIRDDRFAPIAEKAAGDLGAAPAAEPRRAGADPAHRRGHAAPRGARRHRRRRRGRRPRRDEPGRAALAGAQPVRPARHARREPLPLHRRSTTRCSRWTRRGSTASRASSRARPPTGRSWSSRTTTGCRRPCAASTSRPRSSR